MTPVSIRETLGWTAVYAMLVLLTQLGSVSREIINWDESTFMLLGADILDGILPYTERFDNKPPMIFFLMGGWMGVFGDSVLSVRLFGDVCLWLIAILVFLIARRFAGSLAAGAAGAVSIAMNAVEPGLHTSAGLPAMVFVMAALWLCLARRDRIWAMVLAGLLVSLAVLTRSNLAYLALASGAWFAALGLVRPGTGRFYRWSPFAYAAGGAIPVAVLVLIYARAGALAELKLGAVDVALSYSGQWGVAGAFLEHLRKWADAVKTAPVLYGSFTLVTGLALGLTFLPRLQERPSRLGGHDRAILWVFTLSILYSILKSGAVYTYYWQQFLPLAPLLVADMLARNPARPVLRWTGLGLAGAAVSAALVHTLPETMRVLRVPGYMTARYDVRAAAEVLRGRMQPGDRIWALDRHLILLYLDQPSLSPILAHPSNITRKAILEPLAAHGYVAPDELQRVMASLPDFIVSNGHGHLFYFDDQSVIDSYLERNYHLIFVTPLVTVYEVNATAKAR